jgi:L-aspartate oxidase
MMGGIATDLDARATLPGLYAVGECSCTGLHGANRLASNSLTECFVFGARAAHAAAAERAADPDAVAGAAVAPLGSPMPSAASRLALWQHAGLERDAEGLERLSGDPHALVRMIALSALARRETRGAHRRSDYPELDRALDGVHITTRRGGEPALDRWR